MQMQDVRQKARALGVKTGRVTKEELIRAIQEAEGNFPCFKTAGYYCDQTGCCFREDCLVKKV